MTPAREALVARIRDAFAPYDREVDGADGQTTCFYRFSAAKMPGGSSRRFARIVADDDGAIVAHFEDRSREDATLIWEVDDLAGAITKLETMMAARSQTGEPE